MAPGLGKLLLGSSLAVGNAVQIEGSHNPNMDWAALETDLIEAMVDPAYDQGTYAPILIRLAWHSSGTWDKKTRTGGSNGATMRFELGKEANDVQNAGLHVARDLLEPYYHKYAPNLSYSDLWIFAAYVAIEQTQGPKIAFLPGRIDKPEAFAIEPGRLPNPEYGLDDGMELDTSVTPAAWKGWQKNIDYVRALGNRLGFTDREFLALVGGGHAYGRCHREYSGYEGAWMENEVYFNNEYLTDMVDDDWQPVTSDTIITINGGLSPDDIRPKGNKRQYVDISSMDPTAGLSGMRADDTSSEKPTVGRWKVKDDFFPGWVNLRESVDTHSKILDRITTNWTMSIIDVQTDASGGYRGLASHGGWISLVADGGSKYFERLGELNNEALKGEYRMIREDPAPIYDKPNLNAKQVGHLNAGQDFLCREVKRAGGAMFCQIKSGSWVLTYSESSGMIGEQKIKGFNDFKRRQPVKDQYGHQMMLVTDFAFVWDKTYNKILMDYYYTDEDTMTEKEIKKIVGVLAHDFGAAFKKLTENGHPMLQDQLV